MSRQPELDQVGDRRAKNKFESPVGAAGAGGLILSSLNGNSVESIACIHAKTASCCSDVSGWGRFVEPRSPRIQRLDKTMVSFFIGSAIFISIFSGKFKLCVRRV